VAGNIPGNIPGKTKKTGNAHFVKKKSRQIVSGVRKIILLISVALLLQARVGTFL